MDMAEAVGQTDGKEIRKTFPLFIGEAGGHVIVFRVGQVDLSVGNVVVPAGDDRLFFIQCGEVFRIFPVPGLPLSVPPQAVARIGGIDQIEETRLKFQCDHAALQIHRLRRPDRRKVCFKRQAFFD